METFGYLDFMEILVQAWKADINGIITPNNVDLPLKRVSD